MAEHAIRSCFSVTETIRRGSRDSYSNRETIRRGSSSFRNRETINSPDKDSFNKCETIQGNPTLYNKENIITITETISISKEDIEKLAYLLKPSALKIFFFIQEHEVSYVLELSRQLGLSLSTVNLHLSKLKNRGLIKRVPAGENETARKILKMKKGRAGTSALVFYTIADGLERLQPTIDNLIAEVLSHDNVQRIKAYDRLKELARRPTRCQPEKHRRAIEILRGMYLRGKDERNIRGKAKFWAGEMGIGVEELIQEVREGLINRGGVNE
jgi:DNA-binding MarR family transcriptional regulator